MSTKQSRFNPLVLDPDDYDKLFDEDVLALDEYERLQEKRGEEYEPLAFGARRRKPAINPDY